MSNLEPIPPIADQEPRHELALRSVYPDEATPTLGDLRSDPARLAALEHVLAEFGEQLPERQHGVLVRMPGLQGAAEFLKVIDRDPSSTREHVRAIAKQALTGLKKAALAAGLI